MYRCEGIGQRPDDLWELSPISSGVGLFSFLKAVDCNKRDA